MRGVVGRDVAQHAGLSQQMVAYVKEVMLVSGAAIDCNDKELADILFSRMNQLPDQPNLLWQSLEGHEPAPM